MEAASRDLTIIYTAEAMADATDLLMAGEAGPIGAADAGEAIINLKKYGHYGKRASSADGGIFGRFSQRIGIKAGSW